MQRSGFPLPHSLQFRNMDEIFSSLHSLAFPTFPRTVQIYYRFANLDSDRFFVTCRKHRFIELANLQISKNFDLLKSNNREKVIEPSIANHEKISGAHHCLFFPLQCGLLSRQANSRERRINLGARPQLWLTNYNF